MLLPLITSTEWGSTTTTRAPMPNPAPEGRNAIVWLSIVCHEPGVDGVSVGSSKPRRSTIGCEKVSWMGSAGRSSNPVRDGRAPSGLSDAGNQTTRTGTDADSHERGDARRGRRRRG